MHAQRVGVSLSAGAGMLSTFLPWVSLPLVGSIAGTKGDGWFSFGFCVVALLAALGGDRSCAMGAGSALLAMVMGALSAALGVWKIVDLHSAISDDNPFARAASIGPGLYLLVIAGFALILLPFVVGRK